jgi:hypothetical protein
MGSSQSHTFKLDVDPALTDFIVVGQEAEVLVSAGEEFSAEVVIRTLCRPEELKDCFTPQGIDLSDKKFDLCTIKLQIPQSFTKLWLKGGCVSVSGVSCPLLDLVTQATWCTTLVEAHLASIEAKGGITAEKVTCASVVCQSTHEPISITNCTINQTLDLTTMSGLVQVIGQVACKGVITTMSGSIEVRKFQGRGCTIRTMSGDVFLWQGGHVGFFSVSTMSGSLQGEGTVQPTFTSMSGLNYFNY